MALTLTAPEADRLIEFLRGIYGGYCNDPGVSENTAKAIDRLFETMNALAPSRISHGLSAVNFLSDNIQCTYKIQQLIDHIVSAKTMTDAEKREAVAELLNMEGEKNKNNTDLDEIYN